MSLKELQEEFKNTIKPQLEEILSKLNKIQQNNVTNIMEAIAAKIIKEISDKMDKCECIQKHINELKIINQEKEDISDKPTTGLTKYSYPNYDVGNKNLGSSGNSDSLIWPFGLNKK